jgi:hypothetical protein
MSTDRHFAVSCDVKSIPEEAISGSCSFGAFDAAKRYIANHLEGFIFCGLMHYVRIQDTEKHGLHTLWRCEALNHDEQIGAVIWVREL